MLRLIVGIRTVSRIGSRIPPDRSIVENMSRRTRPRPDAAAAVGSHRSREGRPGRSGLAARPRRGRYPLSWESGPCPRVVPRSEPSVPSREWLEGRPAARPRPISGDRRRWRHLVPDAYRTRRFSRHQSAGFHRNSGGSGHAGRDQLDRDRRAGPVADAPGRQGHEGAERRRQGLLPEPDRARRTVRGAGRDERRWPTADRHARLLARPDRDHRRRRPPIPPRPTRSTSPMASSPSGSAGSTRPSPRPAGRR